MGCLTATPEAVLDAVQRIATHAVHDGILFGAEDAQAEVIREEDEYNGVRVTMPVELATARMTFHVDVNVGDPIVPHPRAVDLPRLRGGALRLMGYPLAMVHAEKIITMVERGEANTRWRDFADVYLLSSHHGVSGEELSDAIRAVADHRGARPQPLSDALDGYADLAQTKWSAWIRKQRLNDRLPNAFGQALAAIAEFADPAMRDQIKGKSWDALTRRWTPTAE